MLLLKCSLMSSDRCRLSYNPCLSQLKHFHYSWKFCYVFAPLAQLWYQSVFWHSALNCSGIRCKQNWIVCTLGVWFLLQSTDLSLSLNHHWIIISTASCVYPRQVCKPAGFYFSRKSGIVVCKPGYHEGMRSRCNWLDWLLSDSGSVHELGDFLSDERSEEVADLSCWKREDREMHGSKDAGVQDSLLPFSVCKRRSLRVSWVNNSLWWAELWVVLCRLWH